MAVPKKYIHAFQGQINDSILFPVDNVDDLTDPPKKARIRILTDIYVQDFMRSQPALREQPIMLVRAAVERFLRERGII